MMTIILHHQYFFILSLQLLVGFGFFEGEKGDSLGLGSWFVIFCFVLFCFL